MWQVWINGNLEFEGTYERCQCFASKATADAPDADIQIVEAPAAA